MIQRIQTVFLLLALLANPVVLFLPLGAATNDASMEGLNVELTGSTIHKTGVDEETAQLVDETLSFSDDTMLMVHTILVVLVSVYLLVLIFLYSDRPRQIRLGYVGIVLVMVQIVISALLFMQLPEMSGGGDQIRHDIGFGLFVPVVTLLLTYLAIRRIQKDENMVRNMDRIR